MAKRPRSKKNRRPRSRSRPKRPGKAEGGSGYCEAADLIERVFYPTVVIDEGLRVTVANTAARNLLGYKKSQIEGLDFRRILSIRDDSEVTLAGLARVGREPIKEKAAYYRTRRGEEIPVSFSASFVEFGPDGGMVSITARDMRQALRHQRELDNYKERLRRSEKLALIGTIATSMAHELKNPLATIEAAAYNVEETIGEGGGGALEYIKDIRDEVRDASAIINNLLSFSKTFELKLNCRSVDMHRLINDTLASLRLSAPGRFRVVRRLNASNPCIEADGGRLKSVLNNLFLNAIQAMPPGGEMTVLTRLIPERRVFEMAVRDRGCGIPPKHIDRIIFSPPRPLYILFH